jgi:uncharacterized delta-60 repeat protein
MAIAATASGAPGKLDRDFGKRGWALTDLRHHDDFGNDMAVQGDGRAVVVGATRLGGQEFDFVVARYRRSGKLVRSFGQRGTRHLSFGSASRETEIASSVAIRGGKIVVVGYTRAAGDDFDMAIARFTKSGRLDRSFAGDGKRIVDLGSNDYARDVVIDGAGRILIAGGTTAPEGPAEGFALLRLRSDGRLDFSFADDGVALSDFNGGSEDAFALAQRSDGRIVVAGYGTPNGPLDLVMVAARYTPGGTLDSTFSDNGWTAVDIAGGGQDSADALALQEDGSIVLAGGNSRDLAVARLRADGTPDSAFSDDGQATTHFAGRDHAFDVVLQGRGGIIVAGQSGIGSQSRFAVARYRRDGRLDQRFTETAARVFARAPGSEQLGRAVALQGRSRVLLAGTVENGGHRRDDLDLGLVRLLAR